MARDAAGSGGRAARRLVYIPYSFMEANWPAARAAMLLDPTVANLNTGSFGPLPRVVFERVTELRRRLAEAPMAFLLRELPRWLWSARGRLAEFVGTAAERLIFTANVTTAINLVAAGLTLPRGGEILLTDHEYGSMQWCWERAGQRQGLSVRTFPLPVQAEDPGEIVAAFSQALTERTRLAFFSHVLSPTGLVLPVQEMCAEARRRRVLTVIDGAHAPAMTALEVDAIGADFYAGNCHKWLLAPTGAGFLGAAPGNLDRLQPFQVSWGWRHDRTRLDEPDEFGTTPRLRFYEFEGTRDVCPWLAVPAAIDFQAGLGWEAIRRRNRALVDHVCNRLGSIGGLTPATPRNPKLSGFMTAFRLPPGAQAPHWRQELVQARIEAPIVERPDGLLLRVSTHFFNTQDEIDRLAAALARLL